MKTKPTATARRKGRMRAERHRTDAVGCALAILLFALAGMTMNPHVVSAQSNSPMPDAQATQVTEVRNGHVKANGVRYYYEVHGEGEPLLLLHGGLGSFEMFNPILPILSASHQVIGVDLHGHGRTQLADRPLSIIDMGDDLDTVLEELGYDAVDVMGYSLGGGVAFRLAVQHPERVRRLVLVSAGYSQDAFYPEILSQQAQVGAGMADAMKETPMYQSYAAIAPEPGEFPKLLDAIGEAMRKPYNWEADVKKLEMPVMLVFGDSDMYRLEHIVDFYQLLGGGLRDPGWMREHISQNRLAILPDLTHYEIFMAPQLAHTALSFLNGKRDVGTWHERVEANR